MVSTKCRLSVSWAHWMLFPWRGRSSSVGWVDHVPFYASIIKDHHMKWKTTWILRQPSTTPWRPHSASQDHRVSCYAVICILKPLLHVIGLYESRWMPAMFPLDYTYSQLSGWSNQNHQQLCSCTNKWPIQCCFFSSLFTTWMKTLTTPLNWKSSCVSVLEESSQESE